LRILLHIFLIRYISRADVLCKTKTYEMNQELQREKVSAPVLDMSLKLDAIDQELQR